MKVAIAGAGGRMGRTLIRKVTEAEGLEVSGGLEVAGSPLLGEDLGKLAGIDTLGIAASDDARAVFSAADVIIDFTLAEATANNALTAAEVGTAFVVGTTGMNEEQQAQIEKAAESVAVVQAGNMSLGVNLLMVITKQVSAALGIDWDVEVVESHHRWKVDAPSGTALMLGRAAAEGRGQDHDAVAIGGRFGITGEREKGSIGYAALRGGNVVGEHEVIFHNDDERLVLGHIANDRALFATGAVRAAEWAADKPAGLYSMVDVLGLDK